MRTMYPSTGPVMLDLLGTQLSAEEQELLQHRLVGGVILFTRNYSTPEQISSLCHSIRNVRRSPILIAVDHEGGRVQRFREGFTLLPSMGQIGKMYDNSPEQALNYAEGCGWTMAAELLACGMDFSFAPVLDLDNANNPIIGDRAFHQKPACVIALAKALILGMKSAGMAATGKHFPGHGSVLQDSHVVLPVDNRAIQDILTEDMRPFMELINAGLDAIMPAHIIFPQVDTGPVGFSSYWLKEILRKQCHFSGMIFSDDLNMAGADIAGDYSERARLALDAGCDMVLICNNRPAAIQILEHLSQDYSLDAKKLERMQGRFSMSFSSLIQSRAWQEKHNFLISNRNHYGNS